MSRTQRLFALIELLRTHRYPVSGAELAAELDVSLRTLYRDIATLQEQGAQIDAEPGRGYLLRPGFALPSLMFSEDEIEALVLGSRWVADRGGDARLSGAACSALAKIAAVLPHELRALVDDDTLLIGAGETVPVDGAVLLALRRAIRSEHKLDIVYRDLQDAESARTIWPFALACFDHVWLVVAWCELRQAFRHFRADRIASLTVSGQPYPRKRQVLMQAWRAVRVMAPP
ncbi:helix-turn-helix transcriptional regulator [Bordetella petrii]|uniref:helix-turn-helix transcriptional regulator n=1 Tax=Bordetella petrii TaxID=94624 RepID=UPI001E419B10|nr:YafY family protein [Bordetella petrii]MCD0503437.1 YafY family transcriptional regulator [Bordetella petrii]